MLIETDYRALISAGQDGLPLAAADSVVAIGNFDGVHLGHQALLARARALADASALQLSVLTFNPHPRHYFQPGQPPFLLTDRVQKTEALLAAGADAVVRLRFDALLSELTPAQFVDQVLIGSLCVRHVVVGENFVFGKDRQGTIGMLREMGQSQGFSVTSFAPVADASGGERISSERVRQALRRGRLHEAEQLLGRPWQLRGEVVRGEQLGRNLGFPTANVKLGDYLHPALGVYAASVRIEAADSSLEGSSHLAAVNIGKRPTIGAYAPLLEAHLLNFKGDLYGRTIRVDLYDFIRGERKFGDLDLLRAQLQRDVQHVREGFAGAGSPIVA